MTENEAKAVRFIENIKNHAVITLDQIAKEEPNVSPLVYKGREEKADTILTMIEELQQYRAIGTPEELQTMKEHGGFTGVELANIAAMQMKLKEYEAIGTPEECRAAVEKEAADGCSDCAFETVEEWEMPCAKCKRNCKDYWRRRASDEKI